ncbi:MAG: sugar transferase [Pseudomonadota bacterium]
MTSIFVRILAALALLCLLPILLVLGILVMVLQGRPVLFRQMRSGQGATPFELIKFRSMRDTRDEDGNLLPDDMRTTGIGKFLRRSRLDELPGIWNVVKGDMGIVGPRPLLPDTIAELGEIGQKRQSLRPGLTGWSQVSGNTLLTLDQKVALDLWYIENRNFALDMQIIARTVIVMVGGEKLTPDIPEN